MAILRAFWIILVTPFLPKYGFGCYMDDPRQKLTRIIAFWFSFALLMILTYRLVLLQPHEFSEYVAVDWLTIFFLKFASIILFFFIGGITALIIKFKEAQPPFKMLTAAFAFSCIPEFVFFGGIFYYPEYYQEIRFLCYVWRTVIMILGIYYTENTNMRTAIIEGCATALPLFFMNYNYFSHS